MNYLEYIIGEKHFKGKRKHIRTYKTSYIYIYIYIYI